MRGCSLKHRKETSSKIARNILRYRYIVSNAIFALSFVGEECPPDIAFLIKSVRVLLLMAKKPTTNEAESKAFSVIETGGKQYIVTAGQPLRIEKLPQAEGETITFDKVLLTVDESGAITIGTPYIDGATVTAQVETQGRYKKIRVIHFKSKSNRHKTYGHRQPFTAVKIATK